MKYLFFFIFLNAFFLGSGYAQDSIQTPIQIKKNTLANQMTEAFDQSNSYQEFKVIKKTQIATLRRNILDSISMLQNQINSHNEEFSEQKAAIDSLTAKLKNTNVVLENSMQKEDGIQVFGINTNKNTYNAIVWGIIVLLLLVTAVLFYKYINNSKITNNAELKLAEAEIALEEARQNSIEREQILRRKLQDEINKTRGIK